MGIWEAFLSDILMGKQQQKNVYDPKNVTHRLRCKNKWPYNSWIKETEVLYKQIYEGM